MYILSYILTLYDFHRHILIAISFSAFTIVTLWMIYTGISLREVGRKKVGIFLTDYILITRILLYISKSTLQNRKKKSIDEKKNPHKIPKKKINEFFGFFTRKVSQKRRGGEKAIFLKMSFNFSFAP